MVTAYTDEQLERLHEVLKDILREVVRVCDILGVRPFVTGGTAIGAHYFNGIFRMDDDIDLGMARKDYEKFVREAPALISEGYFLQTPETDPATPYFFAKVRKDGTKFIQWSYKDLPMHQGISVDIFPFDRIPDNPGTARMHQRLTNLFYGFFLRRQVKKAILDGQKRIPAFISGPLASLRSALLHLLPASFYSRRVHAAAAMFNNKPCRYANFVRHSLDILPVSSIENLQAITFEGIALWAPDDIEGYLRRHYPDLKSVDMLESLWKSHAPYRLSFEQTTDDTPNQHSL